MVTLETLRDSIVHTTRPRKVILFGSRARGDSRDVSDYDMVVVVEPGADAEKLRIAALLEARKLGVPIDLIVLDVDSFDYEAAWDSSIIHEAIESGTVIYEAAG